MENSLSNSSVQEEQGRLFSVDTETKMRIAMGIICSIKNLDFDETWRRLLFLAKNSPRYIPEILFNFVEVLLEDKEVYVFEKHPFEDNELEKLILQNYIWGDLSFKFDDSTEFKSKDNKQLKKYNSRLYWLLKEGEYMRVNVVHPVFLPDQHLVAEYREVKMGPGALSRSLFSKNGVDKKRISPVYTLNTGHTYFFYDKNTFLKKRLVLLVEEMKNRGIATNFTELIDPDAEYHPDIYNPEWWGDYAPTIEALEINMDRINKRLKEKEGWYKFWSRPVLTMGDVLHTRRENAFYECTNCRAIHSSKESNPDKIWKCWNCGKNLPKDLVKTSYV